MPCLISPPQTSVSLRKTVASSFAALSRPLRFAPHGMRYGPASRPTAPIRQPGSTRGPAHLCRPAIRPSAPTVHESPLFRDDGGNGRQGSAQSRQRGSGTGLPRPRTRRGLFRNGGHLDGYYTPTNGVPEGTVGYTTINLTIYVIDVASKGGCFTYWPGSHIVSYEYFRTHSLLSVRGGTSGDVYPEGTLPEGRGNLSGSAGDAIFWHSQLFHTGSKNVKPQHPHGVDRPLRSQGRQRYPLRDLRRSMGALGGYQLMELVFSPTLCPDLQLPEILDLSRSAGFTRLELFRDCTQSSPVHPDWSVPMVRAAIAGAGCSYPASTYATSRAARQTPTSAISRTTCANSNGTSTLAGPSE